MSEHLRVGLLSDTHLSSLNHELRKVCAEAFQGIGTLLHAGDIAAPAVLAQLEELGFTVHAVRGNMDTDPGLRSLPHSKVITLNGVRVGICHGSGPPQGIRTVVRAAFKDLDPLPEIILYGHTHSPDDTEEDGIRFINPGSPTDMRFAPFRSVAVLGLSPGNVYFELIRLPDRQA